MTEEKKYTGLNCPDYRIRVLTKRIQSSMREFLDVSSSTSHLEVYRRDLNDLMGKFIEVQSDKRNPHITWLEDFELEEEMSTFYEMPVYVKKATTLVNPTNTNKEGEE